MTENQLRQKVVKIAVSYLGCKEADGSHRKIIDLYNSHKPLARGYAVMWHPVAAAVVVGFAVAYAAMFGFDKLKEALGQIKKNNE